MASTRFNLLVLEEGEYLFDDFAAELTLPPRGPWQAPAPDSEAIHSLLREGPNAGLDSTSGESPTVYPWATELAHSGKLPGRMFVASRSIIFEPTHKSLPLIRCKYADMLQAPSAWKVPAAAHDAAAQPASSDASHLLWRCACVTLMKPGGKPCPHSTIWLTPKVPGARPGDPKLPHTSLAPLLCALQFANVAEVLALVAALWTGADAARADRDAEPLMLAPLLKERHAGPFDVTALSGVHERLHTHAQRPWLVWRVEPLVACPGRLAVSTDALYFQPVSINNVTHLQAAGRSAGRCQRWALADICLLRRRRHIAQETAIEIRCMENRLDDDVRSDSDSDSDSSSDSASATASTASRSAPASVPGHPELSVRSGGKVSSLEVAQAAARVASAGVSASSAVLAGARAAGTAAAGSQAAVLLNFRSVHERDQAYALLTAAVRAAKFAARFNTKPEYPLPENALPPTRGVGVLDRDVRAELRAAQAAWRAGALSNFEYLLILNDAADRTCLDLTQYPVMPWTLVNFASEEVPSFTDPRNFRDLTKPIGALVPERLAQLRERFAEADEDHPTGLYRTHYSTPAYVLYWLVRAVPEHQIKLQSGTFDSPGRLFHSVAGAWRGVLSDMTDVKELMPEWYDTAWASSGPALAAGTKPPSSAPLAYSALAASAPASADPALWLTNSQHLPLGTRGDGQVVNDVLLPPWAKGSPRKFVQVMRDALECPYVSAHLHQWIDLIFGAKASGQAAIEADNLFMPATYEGGVNLDDARSARDRHVLLTEVAEFGQTPRQLFSEPHAARFSGLPGQLPVTPQPVAGRSPRSFADVAHTASSELGQSAASLASTGGAAAASTTGPASPQATARSTSTAPRAKSVPDILESAYVQTGPSIPVDEPTPAGAVLAVQQKSASGPPTRVERQACLSSTANWSTSAEHLCSLSLQLPGKHSVLCTVSASGRVTWCMDNAEPSTEELPGPLRAAECCPLVGDAGTIGFIVSALDDSELCVWTWLSAHPDKLWRSAGLRLHGMQPTSQLQAPACLRSIAWCAHPVVYTHTYMLTSAGMRCIAGRVQLDANEPAWLPALHERAAPGAAYGYCSVQKQRVVVAQVHDLSVSCMHAVALVSPDEQRFAALAFGDVSGRAAGVVLVRDEPAHGPQVMAATTWDMPGCSVELDLPESVLRAAVAQVRCVTPNQLTVLVSTAHSATCVARVQLERTRRGDGWVMDATSCWSGWAGLSPAAAVLSMDGHAAVLLADDGTWSVAHLK